MLTGITVANAQMSIPRASQYGEVEQRIAFTEVEVEYYRPNVRGRMIFGDLVPFDKIWRTGANDATIIEFDQPLEIEGVAVDSGTYAMFTIPGETEWTVVLNSDHEQWGAYNHDESKDVLKVNVPVEELGEVVETFTIGFENVMGNKADLVMMWDRTRVRLNIVTELEKNMQKYIEEALRDPENKEHEVYTNVGRYYFQDGDNDMAAKYLDKALKINEKHWLAWWVRAQVYESEENYKEAVQAGETAIKMGLASDPEFGYADRLKEIVEEWRNK